MASSSQAPAPAPSTTGKLPAAALDGDVGIAAPGSKADGFGYVGVWAKDPAGLRGDRHALPPPTSR